MIAVNARSPASASARLPLPPLPPLGVLDRRFRQAASEAADMDPGGGGSGAPPRRPSRYELQKRRDWSSFGEYLRDHHQPPLDLPRCSGAHVLDFLRYLDEHGKCKTKVHAPGCPSFGHPSPPSPPPPPCPCPLRLAWGSLDALVGRLCAAFDEHGGLPEANPFRARAVRRYLREVRDTQAMARGIAAARPRKKRAVAAPAKETRAGTAPGPAAADSTELTPALLNL